MVNSHSKEGRLSGYNNYSFLRLKTEFGNVMCSSGTAATTNSDISNNVEVLIFRAVQDSIGQSGRFVEE